MPKMLFVNLPVTDLATSRKFYESLGFTNNPKFSDDTSACMVWSETIFAMLITPAKWAGFTKRPVPPPGEVMLALSMDDKPGVDAFVAAAIAHGGTGDPNPAQDHGFMYGRSVLDPDGHLWETFWMDPAAAGG